MDKETRQEAKELMKTMSEMKCRLMHFIEDHQLTDVSELIEQDGEKKKFKPTTTIEMMVAIIKRATINPVKEIKATFPEPNPKEMIESLDAFIWLRVVGFLDDKDDVKRLAFSKIGSPSKMAMLELKHRGVMSLTIEEANQAIERSATGAIKVEYYEEEVNYAGRYTGPRFNVGWHILIQLEYGVWAPFNVHLDDLTLSCDPTHVMTFENRAVSHLLEKVHQSVRKFHETIRQQTKPTRKVNSKPNDDPYQFLYETETEDEHFSKLELVSRYHFRDRQGRYVIRPTIPTERDYCRTSVSIFVTVNGKSIPDYQLTSVMHAGTKLSAVIDFSSIIEGDKEYRNPRAGRCLVMHAEARKIRTRKADIMSQ